MKFLNFILGYKIQYCAGCKCIHESYHLTKKSVCKEATKIIKEKMIISGGYWLNIIRLLDREVMYKWNGIDREPGEITWENTKALKEKILESRNDK